MLCRSVLGYAAAASSGAFSALQSGIVGYGQRQTDGAHPSPHAPPDERFDALGSWLALFGVSAVVYTLLLYVAAAAYEARQSRPCPPSLQPRVMLIPGSAAGIFWSISNVFCVLSILRGGNATTSAQINATALITSGLWGLFYYREIRGRPAAAWAVSAAFTATMAMLLSSERAGDG